MHPLRHHYRPAADLAAPAAFDEFILPHSSLSDHIARHFHLVWGNIGGETQAVILHPALHYPPSLRPATTEEIRQTRAARLAMRASGKTYISKYE